MTQKQAQYVPRVRIFDTTIAFPDGVQPEEIEEYLARDKERTHASLFTAWLEQYGRDNSVIIKYLMDLPERDRTALLTSLVPGVGDVAGVRADIMNMVENPDQRNLSNSIWLAAGALPFVPSRSQGRVVSNAIEEFDPRFDPRKKEAGRLENLEAHVKERPISADTVNLEDHVGRPFVTTMSDRTRAGGELVGINDVEIDPVNLQGGQDFMLENPGQVWASAGGPSGQIQRAAEGLRLEHGVDPLLIPWRMAPTGGDFSTMTGETMLAYASASMKPGAKRSLNSRLKRLIPGWKGIDDPEALEQFRSSPDRIRKQAKQMMDVDFRDRGGLSIGEARLAVADPTQVSAIEGGIMNVGEIHPGELISESGHASYPFGVPGEGLGRIDGDPEATIFDLLPDVVETRMMDPRNPGRTDIRAMQMKPYTGVITEEAVEAIYQRGLKSGAKRTKVGGKGAAMPKQTSDTFWENTSVGSKDRSFVTLSAERGNLSAAENAQRQQEMGAQLVDKFGEGRVTAMRGKYGAEEASYLVDDATREEQRWLADLAEGYEQDSILHRGGIEYTTGPDKGKFSPLKAKDPGLIPDADDFYSEIEVKNPAGGSRKVKFSFDVDWDTKLDVPTPEGMARSVNSVDGVHFSPKDIDTLDPAFAGTGGGSRRGQESLRAGPNKGYIYLGEPDLKPESMVRGKKYAVPADGVYDLDDDPLSVLRYAPSLDAAEDLLKELGAAGYKTSRLANEKAKRTGAAALFNSFPAIPFE